MVGAGVFVSCPIMSKQGMDDWANSVRRKGERGMTVSYAEGKTAVERLVERFARDLDAYQQIGRFLDDVYMHKRIHSSLGCLTPAE